MQLPKLTIHASHFYFFTFLLFYLHLVHCRVGIHLEHTVTEKGLILIWNGDLGQLSGQVGLEASLVVGSIMSRMGSRAFQFIECDIVAGEELIATVDILVHALGEGREELRLGQFCQFINPGIDGSGTVIHHPTLITEDTSLHIVEIVLTTLLEAWDVAFLLKFLGFQVVTGIKLITDGEWHDVEFAQTIGRIFQFIGGTHGQHLQYGVLRAVVRVLCPTLTLSDPDVLLFLGDGIVDITAHQLSERVRDAP